MKPWNFDAKREYDFETVGKLRYRLRDFGVAPGRKVNLRKDYDPGFTGGLSDKNGAMEQVVRNRNRLSNLQEILYAQDKYALLLIFQGIDTAGKDSAIQHVMSGVNPQGCHVTSFKAPSDEELDHDYLWRAHKAMPARGMIGIFNRSYYEEVLVVRVHPEILDHQRLPAYAKGKSVWKNRYEDINNFETYLTRNGVVVMKFFLNLSKDEQKRRFLARIDEKDKNWKFSVGDVTERGFWDDYRKAYEDMLEKTSTDAAPWWVIPADNKWFSRLIISELIALQLERLDLTMPRLTPERSAQLQEIRALLLAEDDK